ncbi:MAG: hypothetical protein JKY61_00055 [Planctomycetes bacterium]|nr:hypothetical protein [Planctomycetota bacterium]
MSGTPHIKSLSIAIESAFGSPSPTTGLPDASGLSYTSMEMERAPLMVVGEAPVDERLGTRASPHVLPPEVNTPCDENGNPIPRRMGQMTIDMVVTNIGSATTFATHADTPIGIMLNSVMQSSVPPAALADTLGATLTTTALTPGVLGNYQDGIGIATSIDGLGEYAFVTDASGPTVTYSPAFSQAPAIGSSMRIGTTYSVRNDMGNLGPSFALRGDGDGWRWYASGCRVAALAITLSPRMVKYSFTVQMADVRDDNGDPSVAARTNYVNPVVADGCVAHMGMTKTKVTTATVNSIASPAASAQTPIVVDEFSATLTFTLAAKGTAENVMGIADYEVTDFGCEVEIQASDPVAALTQSAFTRREMHGLVVGLDNVSEGNGLAIYLPAAALQTDPNVLDMSTDLIRNTYTFKQGGPWTGDVTSVNAASTVFRLLWGN